MDAQYLDETVKDALIHGLSATVSSQAIDPVEYLGNYLIQYVQRNEAMSKASQEDAQFEKESNEYESKREERESAEKKRQEEHAAEQDREEKVLSLLQECSIVDDDVLNALVEHVQHVTGATGVYIAKRELDQPLEKDPQDPSALYQPETEDEEEAEDDEEDGPRTRIGYIAASKDHQFMLQESLKSNQGVTFDAWKLPEAEEDEEEEEEDEEEDEENIKAKAPPELPVVNITDAIQDPNVKFFQIPKLGGYLAVPLRYQSRVHAEAIPEIDLDAKADDEEDEDAEEEKEEETDENGNEQSEKEPEPSKIPEPNKQPVDMAICLDAVGQNRSFTEADIATLKKWAERLRDAYERTEQAMYEEEYTNAYNNKKMRQTDAEQIQEKLEEAKAAADEAKEQKMEGVNEESPDDIRQLNEAQASQQTAVILLKALEELNLFTNFISTRIPPSAEAISVLQAMFYALGYTKADLGNSNAIDKLRFSWQNVRTLLTPVDAFMDKLESFDVDTLDIEKLRSYQETENLRNQIESMDRDELSTACSPIFGPLLDWIQAVLSGREAVVAKRTREKEEEEARKQAEEEAAAAAAEGEQDEENEEEDEDED